MTGRFGNGEDLLIVSFSYAPMLNPRAFRWAALAEEFARRGVRVRVVCSWQPGAAPLQTINGVEIHRVGNRFIERIRALLARLRGRHPREGAETSLQKPVAPLGNLVGWIWRQVAWPDTTCVWYAAALRKAEALLRETPNATIVSVSPTFTAALVGNAITRRQSVLRWVLDMGDPFSIADESPANNFRLYGGLNRRVERELFRNADAVTLTNANVRQRYAELYPECADRLYVIPPLLTGTFLQPEMQPAVPLALDDPIRIVYVGSLYRQLRRPGFLLALFMGLVKAGGVRRLELHFFGDTRECNDAFVPYANQIGRTIQLHGVVPRKDALAAVSEAAIVVNLGNTNPCQLPSKLVEYAAVGKPILNIVRNSGDASGDFMKSYRAILNLHDSGIPPSSEQIRLAGQFIDESIQAVGAHCNDRWIEQFKVDAIADQYAAVLFKVVPSRG
ncbi:MAG: glycosyltransferase [Nitrosomonadales bacterium]|nr:glycosyltransferase [Nitrosomonadales bacterium]